MACRAKWAKQVGPMGIVGPEIACERRGGVITSIGRCNSDKALPLIKASCFLIFFHVGLYVSLCSQATWQLVKHWIKAHE